MCLVPRTGGSWLFGAVATLYGIIGPFAVGGSLPTIVTERLGGRHDHTRGLAFAHEHALFLVPLLDPGGIERGRNRASRRIGFFRP